MQIGLPLVKLITPQTITTHMFNRRKFIKASALSAGLLAIDKSSIANVIPHAETKAENFPIVISTWDFGIAANADAW